MKLEKLVSSQEWLQKLLKVEMDIKKAYVLRKFIIEVDGHLKPYNETRNDLIKKYWTEEDWQIKVKEENIPKFMEEIWWLLNEEIEIEIPEITIDDLGGKIETATLLQLDYLIK